jgi:hypothetical protein
MKPLVIIKSCHKHSARRGAVRATWLPALTWDRMFVLGQQPPGVGRWVNEPYAMLFPVSDEFPNIAPKVHAALKWGLGYQYDTFFICDDDSYVIPKLLERVPDEEPFDYVGWFRPDGGAAYPLPYIQASGMFLSQRAAEIVVASSEMVDGIPDDIAVGRALYEKVAFTHDSRFHPGPVPHLFERTIKTHKALPDTMRLLHEEYLKGR